MKDVAIEELSAISPEIYEAAARVGCTHVSLTGLIWPGGRMSGPAEEAARFVEYSWLKAAVIDGQAIFEETDPKGFAALLARYGLGDEPYLEPVPEIAAAEETPVAEEPALPSQVAVVVEVLPATKRELERQAKAGGVSIGEFLDWKFRAAEGS